LVVAALATKELHADFDYPYDMQLTLPGTPPDVRTIAEGIFSIVPDIVRVPS
jgi:protein involved in ribonucleotide reduction